MIVQRGQKVKCNSMENFVDTLPKLFHMSISVLVSYLINFYQLDTKTSHLGYDNFN